MWVMAIELFFQCVKTLVVIVLCLGALRLTQKAQQAAVRRHWLPPTLGLVVGSISRWLIIFLAALIILEVNGLPIKTLWAALLSLTLVVAVAFFASWSLLSNILSSVLLLTFSRIHIGDWVELKDTKRDELGIRGRVVDINAFFVTLEEAEPDAQLQVPARVQIPSHFFFYRVLRHWPGEETSSLRDAFNAKSP
jgi:small-conductance mechanosensitive channel